MKDKRANLFIVGAPRAGTTQLFNVLARHERIAGLAVKEPNFFSSQFYSDRIVADQKLNDVDPTKIEGLIEAKKQAQVSIIRDRATYDLLVDAADMPWVLDGSTSYLQHRDALVAISNYNPDARILVVLRDPVERTLSHYGLALRMGITVEPLRVELQKEVDAVEACSSHYLLRPSRYAEPLRWLNEIFPQDHLNVVLFEDLVANRETVVTGILNWLDEKPLDHWPESEYRNEAALPRFPRSNAFLHRTGMKSRLKSAMPSSFHRYLRMLAHRSGRPTVDEQDVTWIQERLRPDAGRALELLGRQPSTWSRTMGCHS